jgi:carboxypeptidase C (cathepsin A)
MALSRGQRLDAAAAARIAERLSGYTGLPAAYYAEHDLGISKIAFRSELLRSEGRVLGYLDARYVGEDGDPSTDRYRPAFVEAMNEHLSGWLGATFAEEYRPAFTDGPEDWAYGGPSSPFNHHDFTNILTQAMERNPSMRLMIGSGYFDLTTTFGAAEYLVARSNLPRDRLELTYYASGHMAYTDDASFRQLADDVRRLISGRLRGAQAQ